MNFLFKNILIFSKSKSKENIIKNFEIKNIKIKEFNIYQDYINTLELLKLSQEFAVSIHEITKENEKEIIDLINNYPNIKFLLLYSNKMDVNQIYKIIINGAIDVLPLSINPNLIIAKVIAAFRTEFKKTNPKIITTKSKNITLDIENLKLKIEQKEYKITKKQAAILSILISNENKTVERYKIASIVYSEKIERITPQIIDKHIQLIKENIPPLSSKIKNVWGVGYMYEEE